MGPEWNLLSMQDVMYGIYESHMNHKFLIGLEFCSPGRPYFAACSVIGGEAEANHGKLSGNGATLSYAPCWRGLCVVFFSSRCWQSGSVMYLWCRNAVCFNHWLNGDCTVYVLYVITWDSHPCFTCACRHRIHGCCPRWRTSLPQTRMLPAKTEFLFFDHARTWDALPSLVWCVKRRKRLPLSLSEVRAHAPAGPPNQVTASGNGSSLPMEWKESIRKWGRWILFPACNKWVTFPARMHLLVINIAAGRDDKNCRLPLNF